MSGADISFPANPAAREGLKRQLDDVEVRNANKRRQPDTYEQQQTAQESSSPLPSSLNKRNERDNHGRHPVSDESVMTYFSLKNLPFSATFEDVISVLSPFVRDEGDGTSAAGFDIKMQPATHSAFVTTDHYYAAAAAVEYFNAHTPHVRGSPITASFFVGDETADHADVNSSIVVSSNVNKFRVLLATVTNIRFPVDIDLIYRLFSVYGTIEKIVTFAKPPSRFQSLVQFEEPQQAREATLALNNKCIYDGCNSLQIQTSKLAELVVKANNTRAWDYTVAPFHTKPPAQPTDPMTRDMNGILPATTSDTQQYILAPSWPGTSQSLGNYGTSVPHLTTGMVPMSSGGRLLNSVFDKLPRELQNSTLLQQINPNQTCVVICYNLPAAEISVQKLFNLLSLYGVVSRIKLLREKPDTALIQFSDPLYATLACYFLANAPLFGSDAGLQIGISKKAEVKLPSGMNMSSAEAAEEAKRTMQFSHRDQRCGLEEAEKFIRGACKPTSTLFIANIHEAVTESHLHELLSSVGHVVRLELRPAKERTKKLTAMAEMGSEREAHSAMTESQLTRSNQRQPTKNETACINETSHQVIIQFSDAEGGIVGPHLHLPLSSSKSQLQQLLSELRIGEDFTPYTFRLQGLEGQQVEIVTDIEHALKELTGTTSESVLRVSFFPLAAFRVRPVTRCTSSLEGHSESVLALSFSPDSRLLASGSGDTTVCIWDLGTETPLKTLSGHKSWVMTVCWSPCSRLLASAGMDKNVRVWNVENHSGINEKEIILKGHTKGVSCLVWQPLHLMNETRNVPILASASIDCTIRLWDVIQGITLICFSGHALAVTQIRFSGNLEKQWLFSSSRDTCIKIWDTQNGGLINDLKGHGHWVNTMALNTETITQSGYFDHTAQTLNQINDIKKMAAKRYNGFFKSNCGGVERLVTGSDDCSMILWDPLNQKLITRLTGHQQPVNHVQFSNDGRMIASASFDKSVRLWDSLTGKYILVFRGHVGPVYRLSWSADSNFIVTGSSDSTIKVWDINKRKLKEDLPGHADEVFAIDWSIDGSRVASGSKDRYVKIWRH